MKRGTAVMAAVWLATLAGCVATTGEANKPRNVLSIGKWATYRDVSIVRPKIRSECDLEERVPKFVLQYARGAFDEAALAENVQPTAQGSVLKLEIIGAEGAGGGVFTGSKSLTIGGTLWKDGSVVGTFTAHRSAVWGGLWMRANTCKLLTRSAKRIARDVGTWIEHPTMDARLGFRDEAAAKNRNRETAEKEEGPDEEKEGGKGKTSF